MALASSLTASRKRDRAEWLGWLLSGLVTLFLLADGLTGLVAPQVLAQEMRSAGWPMWTGPLVSALAIIAGLLFALPATAILGAIVVTGFLGGAISAHLRLGEVGSPPQLVSGLLGVAAWGGLWLRDLRLRQLLPVCSGIS